MVRLENFYPTLTQALKDYEVCFHPDVGIHIAFLRIQIQSFLVDSSTEVAQHKRDHCTYHPTMLLALLLALVRPNVYQHITFDVIIARCTRLGQ